MRDDPKIRLYTPDQTSARREAWQDDALCAQTDPDLFTVDYKGASVSEAKKVCAACTVAEQCLAYALENNFTDSVYGGKSPNQRRRLRKAAAA